MNKQENKQMFAPPFWINGGSLTKNRKMKKFDKKEDEKRMQGFIV